jgi:cell division initiation protein
MRITPLDIRKQEFRKTMRGLDADEVYAFLGTVADEYEAVLSDNKRLREHVVQLEERLNEFKSMETNLRNTLMTAERITADAKENAHREADLIVRGAQVEAEKASETIRAHTQQLRREILELKKHKDNYITRLRTLLESHMRMVDGFAEDFAETDREIEAIGKKVEEDTHTPSPAPRMSRERITEDLPSREPADKVTWGGDERREDTPRPTMPPRPVKEDHAEEGGQAPPSGHDDQAGEQRTGDASDAAPELPLEQPDDAARRVVAEGYGERLRSAPDFAGPADPTAPQGSAQQTAPTAAADQWKSYEVKQAKPDWKSYEVPRGAAAGNEAPAPSDARTAVGEPNDSEVENALSGLSEFGGPAGGAGGPAKTQKAEPPRPVQQPPQGQQPKEAAAAPRPAQPAAQAPAQAAEPPRPAQQPPQPQAQASGEAEDAAGWTLEELRKNLTNIDRDA